MTGRLLLAIPVLVSLTGVAFADDRSELIGTWKIVTFHDDGNDRLGRLGAGPGKKGQPDRVAKLVFSKDACWVLRGEGRREVKAGLANAAWKSVTLDESADPKQIDITGFAGKEGDKTKTYAGIYSLEDGKLAICWSEQGRNRPEKLESDGDANLFVCEKISDEPEQPAETQP